MANLFRCGGGSNGGKVALDVTQIISSSNGGYSTGSTSASATVEMTAPSKGVLLVMYNGKKIVSSASYLHWYYYVKKNDVEVFEDEGSTVSTSVVHKTTFIECEQGDSISIYGSAIYRSGSSQSATAQSAAKVAFVNYVFIPT